MARNEEKQLARLNRFYLEKQKQEELKKRPPRPKLDSLTTAREIKQWLPTIIRDMNFCMKQMEVPCYPERKLEEFSEQIDHLKQEYKAFMRKLRTLEPDLNVTSWTNRPYMARKRKGDKTSDGTEPEITCSKASNERSDVFVPISTPVLQLTNKLQDQYGTEEESPITWNVSTELEDQPLQFRPLTIEAVQSKHIHKDLTKQVFSQTNTIPSVLFQNKVAYETVVDLSHKQKKYSSIKVAETSEGNLQNSPTRTEPSLSQSDSKRDFCQSSLENKESPFVSHSRNSDTCFVQDCPSVSVIGHNLSDNAKCTQAEWECVQPKPPFSAESINCISTKEEALRLSPKTLAKTKSQSHKSVDDSCSQYSVESCSCNEESSLVLKPCTFHHTSCTLSSTCDHFGNPLARYKLEKTLDSQDSFVHVLQDKVNPLNLDYSDSSDDEQLSLT